MAQMTKSMRMRGMNLLHFVLMVAVMTIAWLTMVCTDKAKLADSIAQLISNQELQKKYYEQAIVMTREHHNLQASCKTSENVVAKAIQHMK